jgi:hypothetical protein
MLPLRRCHLDEPRTASRANYHGCRERITHCFQKSLQPLCRRRDLSRTPATLHRINVRVGKVLHRETVCLCICMSYFAEDTLLFLCKVAHCFAIGNYTRFSMINDLKNDQMPIPVRK